LFFFLSFHYKEAVQIHIKKNQDVSFYDLKTRTTRTIFDRQIGHSASNFPHLTHVTYIKRKYIYIDDYREGKSDVKKIN